MHWGRAIAIWGVIIVVESIHGVLRTALLTPVIGDLRARQIGVVIGAVLILAIACVLVPWLKARSSRELVAAGLSWVALTVAFEVALGRFVLGSSWDRILADYEPARGGWMPWGLLVMALAPLIATRLRGAWTPRRSA